MGWQQDNDLVTRTIAGWHGGRRPVGTKGATMTDEAIAAQVAETRAARAATRLRGVTAREAEPTARVFVADLRRHLAEIEALRAAVARLAGEIDGWRERNLAYANRLATAESERDAARAALDGLLADVEHLARANHHAHHAEYWAAPGEAVASGRECHRGICPGIRRAVARARAATEAADGR